MASGTLNAGSAWSACESVIRGFETAWRCGGRPPLEAFVPPDAPTRLLVELVHIDLEFRLRAGEDARAEDYLARFPELAGKDLTLDLIAAEYALRRRYHRPAPAEDYLARFPGYETDLRGLLTADGRPPGQSLTRPAEAPPAKPAGVPVIPGYQLLGVVGRGGMGVVYNALDTILHRTVAIKTFAGVPGADAAARFARESEAIARLDHPHIVPVYEVGEWAAPDGPAVPFFVMKWYPGGSLDAAPAGPGTDPKGHARTVATIARAVHHAHQRGVLHRDLKPSNILLDEAGGPHVADFGLAGRFDPAAGHDHTRTAAVVGTPAYMAPEQARTPRQVTTAADIYGLGAVLYQRLTGAVPFKADTPLATLDLVSNASPPRPSAVNPAIPRDLETVCLKCLEKDPARRYASADELADDLDRWAAGRPVLARPARPWEHGWRWARRHPVVAGMGAVTAAAVVTAVVTMAVGIGRVRQKEAEATAALLRESEARCGLESALSREKQALYLERVASAGRLFAGNQLPQAWQLLGQCPEPLRGWEWAYLDGLRRAGPVVLTGHSEAGMAVAFLAEGRLATVDHTGELRVWAAAGGPAVRAWAASAGPVFDLAAHPTRNWVAAVDQEAVTVWDADTGAAVHRLPGATGLEFSPCGRWAAVTKKAVVRVLAVPSWEPLGQPMTHEADVNCLAIAPDGGRLLTGAEDGAVRGWDPATGAAVGTPWRRPRPVTRLTFTADGGTLVESHPEGVVAADPVTGRHRHRIDPTAAGRIFAAAARTPGCVGVGGPNGEVIVWDAVHHHPVRVFRGHTGRVTAVAFSADGRRVASVGADSAVRVWELGPEPGVETLADPGPGGAGGFAVSADGSRLVVAPRVGGGSPADKRAVVYDAATGQEVCRVPAAGAVALGPDGRRLAAGQPGGGVGVWDTATGAALWTRPPAAGARRRGPRLALAPDGSRLAVWESPTAGVLLLDAADGKPVATLDTAGDSVADLTFSPTGQQLAVAGRDGLTLWEVPSGARRTWANPPRGVSAVAFSPDGRWLATADPERVVCLRDVETGAIDRTFVGTARVNALAFRPDGSRLVTGGADDTMRVWDVDSGTELLSLPGVRGPVAGVAWDLGRDRVLALDDAVRAWSAGGP